MPVDRNDLVWSWDRIGEGVKILMNAGGFGECSRGGSISPSSDNRTVERSLEQMTPSNISIQSKGVPYREFEGFLVSNGPMIIRVDQPEKTGFLLILGSNERTCSVIGVDRKTTVVDPAVLREIVCEQIEFRTAQRFEGLLSRLELTRNRRRRASNALMDITLHGEVVRGIWRLEHSLPPSPLPILGRAFPRRVSLIAAGYIVDLALLVASWRLIGRVVFGGDFDSGWLTGWTLILLTIVLVRVNTAGMQGLLAIELSERFKLRFLRGVTRLDLDEARRTGMGRFLSWAIEASSVHDLALEGAFLVLRGTFEILLTSVILSFGAGGLFHVGLFFFWIGVESAIFLGLFQRKVSLAEQRIGITDRLTERLVGHRTVVVQEHPEKRHEIEDMKLGIYLEASREQDRWSVLFEVSVLGWPVVAVSALLPVFVEGSRSSIDIAVAIGGIILGQRAIVTLIRSLEQLGDALISWRHAKPVLAGISRTRGQDERRRNHSPSGPPPREPVRGSPVIIARNLSFQGRVRGRPVLNHLNFSVSSGDKVFLTGPSGSGKSTLAAILAGFLEPEEGILLINGRDAPFGPEEMSGRMIALAPQFGENHIFSESLAFNLLMGRNWPAEPEDLRRAGELCRELGLENLLEKMPLGIHQIVGETGWQLSHGERSRVCIARALLQESEVVILDESLGTLDPRNRETVLKCAERHSRTLIVIDHP